MTPKRWVARIRWPMLGVAAAMMLVVGGASASIPDANGVFHGCYNPNTAEVTNGAPLTIVDSDAAACGKNRAEATWSQTGPQGPPGADGVSVTSSALAAGDTNCPTGGSQFTAAGGNVTYACNGLKGDKGDTGDAGPPGPSAAYTNYGVGFVSIGDGLTQTVASVTVPAGSYVLSGIAHAIGADGADFLQCFFVAGATVNGRVAVLVDDGAEPMLADVTLSSASNPIFLRCFALNGTIDGAGQMIATRVGAVSASE